jgi:hypothetical protein
VTRSWPKPSAAVCRQPSGATSTASPCSTWSTALAATSRHAFAAAVRISWPGAVPAPPHPACAAQQTHHWSGQPRLGIRLYLPISRTRRLSGFDRQPLRDCRDGGPVRRPHGTGPCPASRLSTPIVQREYLTGIRGGVKDAMRQIARQAYFLDMVGRADRVDGDAIDVEGPVESARRILPSPVSDTPRRTSADDTSV